MESAEKLHDLFITHAWRYHDDWTRLRDLFDQHFGSSWRNFSLPWYDPGLDPNTEVGRKLIHRWLEQQIVPAQGIILLSSVYENKSARKWVMLEVELARKYQKRIVGLPAYGAAAMAAEAAQLVDAQCSWDPEQIVATIEASGASAAG